MDKVLSIVIANYNYGRYVGTAIESVLSQYDPRIELIVVDGGSSDDSLAVIKHFSDKIAWWVSEKDNGQSDAFNKGFAHARGRFFTWLNADDVLLPGAIRKILHAIDSNPGVKWFAGNTIYFKGEYAFAYATTPLGNFWPRILQVPPWLRANGPSTFFARSLFDAVGGTIANLKYVMDIDLWMRFSEQGVGLKYVQGYIWGFRLHEESKTSSSLTEGKWNKKFAEERNVLRALHNISPKGELIAMWCKRLSGLLCGGYIRLLIIKMMFRDRSILQISE